MKTKTKDKYDYNALFHRKVTFIIDEQKTIISSLFCILCIIYFLKLTKKYKF